MELNNESWEINESTTSTKLATNVEPTITWKNKKNHFEFAIQKQLSNTLRLFHMIF
jgi:hypothetical protein